MIKIYLSLFLIIAVISCKPSEQKNLSVEDKHKNPVQPKSKLDQILGDKVLDFEKEIIRDNNFDDLLNLSVDDLLRVSELYEVEKIGNKMYHLKQKGYYNEARNFEIILKTKGDSVIDYYCINDELIIGKQMQNDTLFLVTNNVHHPYWKKIDGVNVYAMDQNLNVLWHYQPNNEQAGLNGVRFLEVTPNEVIFKVEITESSTAVYTVYKVKLNKSGELIGYEYESSMNTKRKPSKEFLDALFSHTFDHN